jgi:hypothetical protein
MAMMTKAPVDDFPGDPSMRRLRRSQNPAGCFSPEGLGSHRATGVSPVEDFKRILQEGNKLHHGESTCQKGNANYTWCKEPRNDPLLASQDQEWYAELVDDLKKKFAQTGKSLPVIAAVWDNAMKADARSAQIMNMVCAFERLGVSKRFVLFAASQQSYDTFVRDFPNVSSVFHPHMSKFYKALAERTNLGYVNRLMKLAVAQMVLDTGRDVIITDTDIAWIRDSSEVLHKSGLDFAAMPDACAHDINSGFVYYRNVPRTRDLLHMSLSTWRDHGLCADNDQYLLNCGWMRAAIKGLNYRVLPSNSWSLACSNYQDCRCTDSLKVLGDTYGRQMFGIGDGYPYIMHTYGMSTNYMQELDMFAALDMIDVDFKTGQCKQGPKLLAMEKFARSCSTREDGINHAKCGGSCKSEPVRAKAIVADLGNRSVLTAFVPPPPPAHRPPPNVEGKGRGHQHHHHP